MIPAPTFTPRNAARRIDIGIFNGALLCPIQVSDRLPRIIRIKANLPCRLRGSIVAKYHILSMDFQGVVSQMACGVGRVNGSHVSHLLYIQVSIT